MLQLTHLSTGHGRRCTGQGLSGRLPASTLAARLGVLSIPTLLVYRDGVERARLEGVQKPDDVLAAVQAALEA